MKFPEGGGLEARSSCSPVVLVRSLAGRAREVLRNSRKDVLPEFWVPTTRRVSKMLVDDHAIACV